MKPDIRPLSMATWAVLVILGCLWVAIADLLEEE